MKATTAILLVLFLIGCGKKGNPTPPVPIIPRTTSDLAVAQRGPTVVLSFSYPSLTSAGTKLPSIQRIAILRHAEPLPPSLAGRDPREVTPGETDPGVAREIALFENVPLIPAPAFARLSREIDAIDGDEMPEFTLGAEILYSDTPPVRDEVGTPLRYTYSVVTEGPGGRSDLSNLASIVPLAVAQPPSNLRADAGAAVVRLDWDAPSLSIVEGVEPSLIGYNIYRFPPEGEIRDLGNPLNGPSPVGETTFSDTPAYGTHRYIVTAVSSTGPPVIESDPTSSILVEFRDRVAPEPPPEVITLAEDGAVRLLWEAVEAPDFAGYLVYRLSETRQKVLLTPKPISETNFRDATPERGMTYTYWVSSVDTSGNEGTARQSAPVLVAR